MALCACVQKVTMAITARLNMMSVQVHPVLMESAM